MHPLIDPYGNYEPSSSTKKRWLYTRKKVLPFGDLTLPGLYQTDNFKVDRFLFWFVIGLEVYGVYVLWNILPTPIYALVGLAGDLFCAIFSHLCKKKLCLARNKKKLAEHGISFSPRRAAEFELDHQSKNIRWCTAYELFWYLLIAGLALVKVLSILSYATGLVLGFKIFLILIYISTAYIHIFHTGYFIYELWFRLWASKERRKVIHTKESFYLKERIDDGILNYRRPPLSRLYKSYKVNKQFISTDAEHNRSILNNWGVLQDNELLSLAGVQEGQQQMLAIELLECQIGMLALDASRGDDEINILAPKALLVNQ